MKRKELEKRIRDIAKASGLTPVWTEGGNHSKVTVGKAKTVVPRHGEINELTANGIIQYIERNAK
ncbi:hypothetical protein EP30_01245 [Bifidobacterium sp. UTCIF-39]|uniref:hypothetical protein n=1 Tax=Bifidobacterium sp. UTCIF-39 TaxID=1465359 RepID=UPI00112E3685|nr:hypothetical protein [Bifidobacterium sp. UTCIF-39]TPF97597.1 hypothetical protein EP30_01245 [Bifidobacterium sp. UTCIF-39]